MKSQTDSSHSKLPTADRPPSGWKLPGKRKEAPTLPAGAKTTVNLSGQTNHARNRKSSTCWTTEFEEILEGGGGGEKTQSHQQQGSEEGKEQPRFREVRESFPQGLAVTLGVSDGRAGSHGAEHGVMSTPCPPMPFPSFIFPQKENPLEARSHSRGAGPYDLGPASLCGCWSGTESCLGTPSHSHFPLEGLTTFYDITRDGESVQPLPKTGPVLETLQLQRRSKAMS